MITSTLIKNLSMATAGAAFITLGAVGAAQAQVTLTESVDAGDTLGTAQNIPSGTATLDSIFGTISSPNDADLYRLFINDPAGFQASARQISGTSGFDTQLFLFNSDGFGVYANDNQFSSLIASLPPGSQFSPTQPGFYFLGVSNSDNDPESVNGEIFSDPVIPNLIGEPTGPGGGSPFIKFNGEGTDNGSGEGANVNGTYELSLAGVQAVPEPSSILGFLTFGAFGARAMLKRFRGKCKN